MTALPISRLICSHDFYWSRKRQADVCRRCGALSPVLALHFRSKTSWTVGADLPPERGAGFEALPALPAPPVAAAEPAAQVAAFAPEPTPAPAQEVRAPEVSTFEIPASAASAQIAVVDWTPPTDAAPAFDAPEPETLGAEAFEPEVFEVETFTSDPFSRPILARALTDFSGRDAAPLLRPLVT
jgi:hypothetical protein